MKITCSYANSKQKNHYWHKNEQTSSVKVYSTTEILQQLYCNQQNDILCKNNSYVYTTYLLRILFQLLFLFLHLQLIFRKHVLKNLSNTYEELSERFHYWKTITEIQFKRTLSWVLIFLRKSMFSFKISNIFKIFY